MIDRDHIAVLVVYTSCFLPACSGVECDNVDDDIPPAYEAAIAAHDDKLDRLIRNGEEVNQIAPGMSDTLLGVAVLFDNESTAKLLLQHGADPDLTKFTPPLSHAARRGHEKLARLLVEHGADVNAKGGGESTPLMAAAIAPDLEFLVAKGADVLAKDANGMDAEGYAHKYGHRDVAEFLRSVRSKHKPK